jgi:peptide/nickel transport system substrate-binding protein
VVEVNPGDDRILRTVSAGSDPVSLAATAGKMWVANEAADTVTPIVLASGRPGAPIHVGHGPDALAVSGGSVWVACGIDGTVWRIDAGSASAKGSFSVGAEPRGIAVVANRLVVAGARGVTVFDRRGLPVSRVHVQGTPAAALSSRGVAWVAAGPMLAAHRGGVLKIETTALSYPPGSVPGCRPSLDAQSICAYTTAPWQVSSLLHDGLLTFKHVPGPDGQTIVADLAQALPTVSRDRRTFVFQLRHGVRYSDGRPVRPSDIQRGIERTYRINPAGQPFFTYYSAIAGAAKCAARPRTCDLSHGIVADDAAGTVTFHLTRPDPNFLAALALPFAIAVPVGTPMSDLDFRINLLPATGPYAVSRADPTHGLLLVRNPHFRVWSADAQPAGFPNHVVWKVAPSPNREVADVLAGRADWMDDTMPADAGRRLLLNHPELLHPRTLAALHAIFLNPGMAPFDAVRARQAVEYAVGRATLLRKLGPLFGAPTCQMLPPGIPGYRPNRPCPFTIGSWGPNIAKARSLVSESGTTGDRVNIWTRGDPVISPVTRYIRGVLRSIGYQATLIPANHANTVPIEVFPAGVGADFPAASFFLGTTGCAPSPQGCPWTRAGWLDQLKTHALAAQLFNTYFASERWAELDRRLTDSGSTWVPLFNDIAPGLTSRRVGNYELTASPVGAPLIDQMWVK